MNLWQRKRLWELGRRQVVSFAETARVMLSDAKADSGAWPYSAEVPVTLLQQPVWDAQHGFTNFFKSSSGQRKSERARPPRLKSKRQYAHRIRRTRSTWFQVRR